MQRDAQGASPNAQGGDKPKNEADKSSLLVREFDRELTYRNGSWAATGHVHFLDHPHLSTLRDEPKKRVWSGERKRPDTSKPWGQGELRDREHPGLLPQRKE